MKGPAVAILLAGLVCGVASHPDHTAEPETTPAANVAAASTRVTTSFYSFVTTQIPRDERSIGMGLQREGTDEYCESPTPVIRAHHQGSPRHLLTKPSPRLALLHRQPLYNQERVRRLRHRRLVHSLLGSCGDGDRRWRNTMVRNATALPSPPPGMRTGHCGGD